MQTHKISWRVGMTNQLPDQLSFLRLNTEEPTSKDLSLPLERIPEPGHLTRPVDVRGSSSPVHTGAIHVLCAYLIESVKLCLLRSM